MYVDKMKEAGGLFNVKIELAGAYDDEATKAELSDPETKAPYFFILRELTGDEYREIMDVSEKDRTPLLEKKLGECLLSHNLRNSDRTVVSNEDAIAAARQYGSLFYYILQKWQKNIPLIGRTLSPSKE